MQEPGCFGWLIISDEEATEARYAPAGHKQEEVAVKYPGKKFSHAPRRRRYCGATDGLRAGHLYGRCTLPPGHQGSWHQEWRGRKLWAEWRGPAPGEVCGICHRDGSEH